MKRILVTGGAGFIGSHLTDSLIQRGYHVVVLDNLSGGRRDYVNAAAEFVQGDVTEPAHLEPIFAQGVDAVLHLAAQASIRLSFADPWHDLRTNTLGTINLLQACLAYRVPRLLFASSMTIYGNSNPVPTAESAPPDPASYYAITKYAAERYVHLTAARRDLASPLHVTSFRMFNVYGERQSLTNAYQGVLAIFIGNVLRGEPITIHSDGEQSRDFVHISDVVRAWIDALEQPATYGQIINLGTGTPTTVNALCDAVLSAFGKDRGVYPVRYGPAQPGDMRASAADIRRARELLDWQPRVPFAEGIQQTITWARTQLSEPRR
ncbi:MAG: NAD-dependent epimerase/dehydratase family protein [Aggregatilineales bacterium]